MKVARIAEKLSLKLVCGDEDLDVERGCTGDLLSEVMRTCRANSIWVTVQSHVNVIAVAVVVGIKAIVLCNGYEFPEETIEKAKSENIALLVSSEDPFTVSGKIYSILEGRGC